MNRSKLAAALWVVLQGVMVQARATDAPAAPASITPAPRFTVLISDTHFGVGHQPNGSWDPTEDFRWPDAFDGFLNFVNTHYGAPVDLVILGDFLELWQPPKSIPCKSPQPRLGCTVKEMIELVTLVTNQHQHELTALARFAALGENHVYLVPGNHDSALVIPEVWTVLETAIHAAPNRVTRVDSGLWISADGLIQAEHGHQIGQDVNRYANWPAVTTTLNGVSYMIEPWGARFVQSLYNDVEREYPIIDNLVPESVGARFLMADRGIHRSADDLAKFLLFNLFETSIRQKLQVLSASDSTDPTAQWSIDYARGLGARLFRAALDSDDALQGMLSGKSTDDVQFQAALARTLQDKDSMPDENVLQLCEHAAINGQNVCKAGTSGAVLQGLLNTKEHVIKAHLNRARVDHTPLTFYVYGHTHQVETPWDLAVSSLKQVQVANTGAFQRLIDESTFKEQTQHLAAKDALRSVKLEQLPPCYSYVVVTAVPAAMEVLTWQQEEGKPGQSQRSLSACKKALFAASASPAAH